MRDYKFRQSELSFKKPKRTWRKAFRRVVLLILAAGVVYGIVQLWLIWQADSEAPKGDSDVIPLPLPPHVEPDEETRPDGSRPDPGPSTEAPSSRSVTEAAQLAGGGQPAESVSPDTKGPATAQGKLDEALEDVATLASGTSPDARARADDSGIESEDGTWIEYEVQPGDCLAKIFQDNGLSAQLLHSILSSGKAARQLRNIRPEDKLRIHLDEEQQFEELHLQLDALRSVKFAATDSGIKGTKILKDAETKEAIASGVVDHTLFASAAKAGLTDAVTMQLARIFGWDIDFALDIRPGDRFTVIYDQLWTDDGEKVGTGKIVAAEFVNQGHSHRAVRFKDGQGTTRYYSPAGVPLKKTFFRTPVKFSRVSSGFSKRRWHPVLKRWRAHRGVDYAAPSGTPIIATGDGRVAFRGWQKGYGRVVKLRHGRKYETVYGHMSRFAKGLSKGDRVKQGEVIGYVGKSGLATGPHLHYEFHVNGVHRNPLTVKAPIADPLPPKELATFRKVATPLLESLVHRVNDLMVAGEVEDR